MQGQKYIYLYTPCITYEDSCAIMIQTKYDSSCWILFDCSTFRESQIWWSGQLYILFWKYCPRDVLFFGSDKDAFIHWFQAEIEEASHYEAWFIFNLSFQGSELLCERFNPPNPQSYKVTSDFFGDICVPDDELILAMQGSPLYKCFNGLPPFSDHHGSPPSSQYNYDSGDSFDSIAEHNINNWMEA